MVLCDQLKLHKACLRAGSVRREKWPAPCSKSSKMLTYDNDPRVSEKPLEWHQTSSLSLLSSDSSLQNFVCIQPAGRRLHFRPLSETDTVVRFHGRRFAMFNVSISVHFWRLTLLSDFVAFHTGVDEKGGNLHQRLNEVFTNMNTTCGKFLPIINCFELNQTTVCGS